MVYSSPDVSGLAEATYGEIIDRSEKIISLTIIAN